jgi:hypothetical protein
VGEVVGGAGRPRPFGNPLNFKISTNVESEKLSENVKINTEKGLPLLWPSESLRNVPLIIVGGGPSLKDYVEDIRELQNHGAYVMGLNKAYHFLVENDVIPEYFLMSDGRVENMPLSEGIDPGTMCLLASQVHPDVVEAFASQYSTFLYHLYTDSTKIVTQKDPAPKPYILAPVGVSGYYGIYCGATMGYRNLICYGFDFSYENGDHHAFEQPLNDDMQIIDVNFGGETFYTNGIMAYAAERFAAMSTDLYRRTGTQISVCGRGLLPALLLAGNARGQIDVEERERKKYRDIWATEQYGEDSSPGMDHVQLAMLKMDWSKGDTVIDFGCGKGEAVSLLSSLGFQARGVDIASNAVAHDIQFTEVCLWNLPKDIRADWGYCCDVMEHIPTEKVQETLKCIADAVDKGIYFNIATEDDCSGAMIGFRLHLTVMKASAWTALLKQHFSHVEVLESEFSSIFVCKK